MMSFARCSGTPDMLRIVVELSSEILAVSFFVAVLGLCFGLATGII